MYRALLALVATTRVAFAQPVEPPPDPPPAPPIDPYPAPLPPQEPIVSQPPPEPAPLVFTPDEAMLLQRGEIDGDKRVYGIVANVVIGFGLGQAIQGRWKDTGWKFTLGQTGGVILFFAAAGQEGQNIGFELVAGLTLLAFYGWGIIDAAVGPEKHNDRIREIKARHGIPYTLAPYVNRTHEGGTAGLAFRF